MDDSTPYVPPKVWQIGSAPYLGDGFGHFMPMPRKKSEYPINRYAMEIKRQLNVLDRDLASRLIRE